MEDKLREYRFLNSSARERDNKAVVLSQLEGVRRDLVHTIERCCHKVVFGKEIIREVIQFARTGEDDSIGGNTSAPPSPACHGASVQWSTQHLSPKQPLLPSNPSTSSMSHVFGPPSRESSIDPWLEEHGRVVPKAATEAANKTYFMNTNSNRHERFMYGSSKYGRQPLPSIHDEDIYGPPPPKTKAPPAEERRRQEAAPGGVLHIKNLLDRAEQGLNAVAIEREQRRSPAPPKILGEAPATSVVGADWEAALDDSISTMSAWTTAPDAETVLPNEEFTPVRAPSTADRSNWRISAVNPHQEASQTPISMTAGNSSPRAGGLPNLVGKLAGFAFVLGSIAAAALVATHSPHVEQKKRPTAGGDLPPWSNKKKIGKTSAISKSRSHRSSSAATVAARGSPVMNVRSPPVSDQFPSSPAPDVSVAMG